MAVTVANNTLYRAELKKRSIPLKANAHVYLGTVVCVDSSGYGVNGATATGLIVAGLATATVDNTGGSSGAVSVDVMICEAYLKNSGGDAVDQTCLLSTVYLVDNVTVSKTNGSSSESAAGICTGFDSGGVWVSLGSL